MRVHFTFKVYTGPNRDTTIKTFESWVGPLPNIGDMIAYDNSEHVGTVSRREWDLDDPNEVYVLIDSDK